MAEQPRPRRALVEPEEVETRGPRRAADPDYDDEPSNFAEPLGPAEAPKPRRRIPWLVVAVTSFLLIALTIALLLTYGIAPLATPGNPTDDSSIASPRPTDDVLTGDEPGSPQSPEQGGGGNQTTPPPPVPGTPEKIDDTTITVPPHWRIYADEVTEGNRRLLRLIEDESRVRLQVATITTMSDDLHAACGALINDQGQGYTVDSQLGPREITALGDASAVMCGFVGTKEGETTATNVMFTLVQRPSDEHTLVLRVMRPDDLAPDNDALQEVSRMSCEASREFGHPLPLC